LERESVREKKRALTRYSPEGDLLFSDGYIARYVAEELKDLQEEHKRSRRQDEINPKKTAAVWHRRTIGDDSEIRTTYEDKRWRMRHPRKFDPMKQRKRTIKCGINRIYGPGRHRSSDDLALGISTRKKFAARTRPNRKETTDDIGTRGYKSSRSQVWVRVDGSRHQTVDNNGKESSDQNNNSDEEESVSDNEYDNVIQENNHGDANIDSMQDEEEGSDTEVKDVTFDMKHHFSHGHINECMSVLQQTVGMSLLFVSRTVYTHFYYCVCMLCMKKRHGIMEDKSKCGI
jgi:hypothetical protein